MNAEVKETLRYLPTDALKAFWDRTIWEYTPESIESGDCCPSFDDDDGTFRLVWYVPGWYIDDRRLYSTIHDVDTDGNWDMCDCSEVGTDEYQWQQKTYGYEESQRMWLRYWEAVIDTGEDTIGELYFCPQQPKPRKWQASICRWIGDREHGLKVRGVRRRGRGPFIAPQDAPKVVQDYLLLNDKDCIEDDELRTLDAILKTCNGTQGGNRDEDRAFKVNDIEVRLNFVVDEPPKPWTGERMRAYVRKRARDEVRRIKERKRG